VYHIALAYEFAAPDALNDGIGVTRLALLSTRLPIIPLLGCETHLPKAARQQETHTNAYQHRWEGVAANDLRQLSG
jgi:hypothetical protein